MTFTDAQLLDWVQHYAWTFARIAGVMIVAPVLGSHHVPRRIRVALAILLTLVMAPLMPMAPASNLFSGPWWLGTVAQFAIGLSIGFVLLIAFEAVVMGGELIAYGMGLSFAQLADPVRGVSTPVIGQFLLIITTLLFLAMNGHLMLIEVLAQSFRNLPVSASGLPSARLGQVVEASSLIFAGGLQLSLPLIVALLLANMAFGVASRATPSLNLQSVGMPIALIAGLLLLAYSLPSLPVVWDQIIGETWQRIAALISPP